ncbi:MAG TPA: peptidoglycan-associated lipoprotein Pal [Burkholderiaceae bacterium]|jgi:peptidoglycan-associated lipoprotein|nr:peptidoglycan-associated lipoprotein Pal [Burkholderiaceae bacterium]
MSSMRVLFVASAAALAMGGCASTKLEEKPAPVVEQSKATPAPAPAPAPPPPVKKVETPPPPVVDPLNDPNSILAKRSVYFDFDKSLIKVEYQTVIEAHGRYLVEHATRQVRIEGNCDERGGREYNLALGQRRADAVRERMELVGVVAARIETISFGKEKPKALGHDEAAWAENRRADIVYR